MHHPLKISNLILSIIFSLYTGSGCSDNTVVRSDPPVSEYTQIDFEPSWSSDSKSISYIHSDIDIDYRGIYTISPNGNNDRLIISDFARCPGWSPDDEWIVYTQFDQIFKYRISADSSVGLTSGGKNYFPKWCPDSGLIAYSSNINSADFNIMIMNTDGTQNQLIDENGNYPNWQEGRISLIYFKPVKTSGNAQQGDSLIRYFLTDGTKQTIAVISGNTHKVNMYPVFAGDRYIFCSSDSTGSVYIYSMDAGGNSIVRLTSGQGYCPDYSFVSEKIVYTNRSRGNGRLWIMDKNGDNKMQLTN